MADSGYYFLYWQGDYTGIDEPLVIANVTADMTIAAVFSSSPPQYFTVTFHAGPHGSLIGTTPQNVRQADTTSAVRAVPDNGYLFSGWSGDVTATANPLTLQDVQADMALTANFSEIPSGTGSFPPGEPDTSEEGHSGGCFISSTIPPAEWN